METNEFLEGEVSTWEGSPFGVCEATIRVLMLDARVGRCSPNIHSLPPMVGQLWNAAVDSAVARARMCASIFAWFADNTVCLGPDIVANILAMLF